MADQKFTDLAAVTPPIDAGSLVAFSTYDGVSAYTSEKVTLTQLRDAVYLMEAEDKITFDSSGTNKDVIADSNSNYRLSFNKGDDFIELATTDLSGTNYGGYTLLSESSSSELGKATLAYYNTSAAFDEVGIFDNGVKEYFAVSLSGVKKIEADGTGLGFFNTTPAAQPTGVAVTAGGIHAALVTLGLITA